MPGHSRGKIVGLDFLEQDLATEEQWYKQQTQYTGHFCSACVNLYNQPIIRALYVAIKNNSSVKINSRVELAEGGGVAVNTQPVFYSFSVVLLHSCY